MNAILRIMFGSELFQRIVKIIVYRKSNPEDMETVGIKMSERVRLLVLNRFLEGADRLHAGDFY
jgi:hypothetical protein